MHAEIYSDGSCDALKNGGYGILIMIKGSFIDEEVEIYDGAGNTTSTKMELTAAINAIRYLKKNYPEKMESINLYADFESIQEYMTGNKNVHKPNFLTSPDRYLWLELHELAKDENIIFHWVKGHDGDINNIRADKLAKAGRMKYIFAQKSKMFVYYHVKIDRKNLLRTNSDKRYNVNVIMKSEEPDEDKILKKKCHCNEERNDKDFIELTAFKDVLEYSIRNTRDIQRRKLIIFSDNPMVVRNTMKLKKGKLNIEEQRYSYIWKEILNIMKGYDIEIYKSGQSKLHYFDITVEEHNQTQNEVRELVA